MIAKQSYINRGIKRLIRIVRELPVYLRWYVFRLRHRPPKNAPNSKKLSVGETQSLESKELFLRKIIQQHPDSRFLEVGIGGYPNFERHSLFHKHNIRYTGCDFSAVCQIHEKALVESGISLKDSRYFGNQCGSYTWTLRELLVAGEQFDVIYLDGHHTFYVDLPAAILCHFLLKTGGTMILDDIEWSLSFLKRNMARFFAEFALYEKAYDFKEYDLEQQNEKHVKMIAQEILINQFRYQHSEQTNDSGLWVLKKPI